MRRRSRDQPVFVVSIGQGGPEQAEERANFARNMFTGLADFKDVRIVSGDMLRLGGGSMPTHELQAEAKDAKTDTPMRIVQWVRFGPGAFVRMIGVARADAWSKEFPRFRAVRDGVEPARNRTGDRRSQPGARVLAAARYAAGSLLRAAAVAGFLSRHSSRPAKATSTAAEPGIAEQARSASR